MACSGYHQGGGSQENPENGSSGDSLLTKDDSFNRKVEKQSMEKGTGNESHDWVRVRGRFKNNSEKVTRGMLNKWNFMKHLWRRRLRKEMKKQRSMCQRHSFGVVSSCTGTQKKETLTNCVITPCMVMKTIGIPSCTGTPGQPPFGAETSDVNALWWRSTRIIKIPF